MDNVFLFCLSETAIRFRLGSDNRVPTARERAARSRLGLWDSNRKEHDYESAIVDLKMLGRDDKFYSKDSGRPNYVKGYANNLRNSLNRDLDRELTDVEYGYNRFDFLDKYGFVGNCGDRAEYLASLLRSRGFSSALVLKHISKNDDHAWVVVSQNMNGAPWNMQRQGTAKSLLDSESAPKVAAGQWFFLDPWLRHDVEDKYRKGYYWHGYIFDPADNEKFVIWKKLLDI